MSRESRMLAGVLLVVIPTVMYGGLSLLFFLTRGTPGYVDNPLRHDLFRFSSVKANRFHGGGIERGQVADSGPGRNCF